MESKEESAAENLRETWIKANYVRGPWGLESIQEFVYRTSEARLRGFVGPPDRS
jgi:hypothetical protein